MRAKPSNRLWKKIGIAAAAVFGVLLAGTAVYTGYLANKASDAIGQISAAPATGTPIAEPSEPQEREKPLLFLVAGVDNREGGGGSMNTDVLMLVALDRNDRAATVVSLPRDLRLKPPGMSSQKANYYYAYYYNKDRDSAIANTKSFFGDLLHLPIDYMAVIDFDGFRKLVDALGGLQIDVDMDMRYVDEEDGTNINLKKGLQQLSGKQTLDFVRYRKSNMGTAESSDIARNDRQHQVVEKLLDKLTSLGGITQWGTVLDIAGKSVKTDVPESVLRGWIMQLNKLKPEQIEFVPLEGKWDSPYIVPKEETMRTALDALRARLGLAPSDDSLRLSDAIALESAESTTVTKDTYQRR
ncbi:LCP family protein [Paenibacillus sp. GYB003]|uniref:LCP family protein n=1 Tax=Paenibacillus sp. GYB003 TaxID=2994392 RepID=UPI002F96BA18